MRPSSPVSRKRGLNRSGPCFAHSRGPGRAIEHRNPRYIQDIATGPEIFIGLIGATGSPLGRLSEELTASLEQFRYHTVPIRLIDLIVGPEDFESDEAELLDVQMSAGSEYRKKAGRGDALALRAMERIREVRDYDGQQEVAPAYVLSSLKNPEELRTLRDVYGPRFIAIGAHCPRRLRLDGLAARFSSAERSEVEALRLAEEFIARDADEGEVLGQNINLTFHQADCFVEVGDHLEDGELRRQVERIMRIFFGDPFHTPTREERGMFMAAGAAAQSAELTRQVGAAVMRDDGSIISVGCNEVPRFGGGVYWEGDEPDHREITRSRDSAAAYRTVIARSIADALIKKGVVAPDPGEGELSAEIEAGLRGVTEFGRASHAEMTALFSAAAAEATVIGATVLTTTFPCHTCTRYMLTAGIGRVVYVSPYDRSRAADLYPEAIEVDPPSTSRDASKMRVEPFIGVAPRRYLEWFGVDWRHRGYHQVRSREDGEVLPFDPKTATPISVSNGGVVFDELEYLKCEANAVNEAHRFDS